MNLNDRVEVTLTAQGAATLTAYRAKFPAHRPASIPADKLEFVAGDVYREQLWRIFNEFDGLYCGSVLPFEGGELRKL